mmetsp:Transcript_57172/g.65977  ORF Transcript_57172/g.65977 Transcript_57172/m.65977 type:complete len:251 (+) Transcript_57172:195-947(+)|eukprot:CAMPEP_0170789370 /NCGR_PEP_ID=MMETSP0733-20121128/19657_1 /TAXON_ID=186038 /ORGANISM="Fragilariopsis kerguelensis, Strain L26-C5" /LENGTH=250 /DNA_ID=CAMNT_0011136393 /DNA_START=175 /DNA_END=927 /DNA_ORIENTATION=-
MSVVPSDSNITKGEEEGADNTNSTIIEKQQHEQLEPVDSGPILLIAKQQPQEHRFDILRSWVRQNILQDLIQEETREIFRRSLRRPSKNCFFGRMSNKPSSMISNKCYVSYCGSDREKWNTFVNGSRTNQQNNNNVACVWIPHRHIGTAVRNELDDDENTPLDSSSPCRRWRRRSNNTACCPMCQRLYTRQYDERGCSWFLFWIMNVERARALNQELIVGFEPSFGIGESQWLEIEWLTLNNYEYTVEIF